MCIRDRYPNLSEGADRVDGQLRGDKECPFSGVTEYGRVWGKVPESDARSVHWKLTVGEKSIAAHGDSNQSEYCATLPASLSGTFLQIPLEFSLKAGCRQPMLGVWYCALAFQLDCVD